MLFFSTPPVTKPISADAGVFLKAVAKDDHQKKKKK